MEDLVKLCEEGYVSFWDAEEGKYVYGFNLGQVATSDDLEATLSLPKLSWLSNDHRYFARKIIANHQGWEFKHDTN